MLGIITTAINVSCEAKTWKAWLDYILRRQKIFNLRKVALYHSQGHCLAATQAFKLPQQHVMTLQKLMRMPAECRPDAISFHNVTYVIKSVTSSQVIAFNGSRYLIVARSKSIIITTLVKSRVKSEEAVQFLKKIVGHLVKQNY